MSIASGKLQWRFLDCENVKGTIELRGLSALGLSVPSMAMNWNKPTQSYLPQIHQKCLITQSVVVKFE
jgi:hypothetical protein